MAALLILIGLFLVTPTLVALVAPAGMVLDRGRFAAYGLLFAFGVGILLSQMVPAPAMDLSRYWVLMEHYSLRAPAAAVNEILRGEDPLSYLTMYLVATTLGKEAIAGTAAVIGYSCYFFIIWDSSKRLQLSTPALGSVLTYFLLSHHIVNVFTGFRFGLGLAIFFLGAYCVVFKSRPRLGAALMLAACFFHSSVALFLILFVFLWAFRRVSFLVQSVAVAGVAASTSALLAVSETLASLPAFDFVARRAEYYLSGYVPGGTWYIYQVATGLLFLACGVALLRELPDRYQVFWRFSILLPLAGLLSLSNFHIASRLFTASRLTFILLLLFALAHPATRGRSKLLTTITAIFVALGAAWNQWASLSVLNIPTLLFENFLDAGFFVF